METYYSPKVGEDVLTGESPDEKDVLSCFFELIGIAGVSTYPFVSSGIFQKLSHFLFSFESKLK